MRYSYGGDDRPRDWLVTNPYRLMPLDKRCAELRRGVHGTTGIFVIVDLSRWNAFGRTLEACGRQLVC
jgi:hypothetical protein